MKRILLISTLILSISTYSQVEKLTGPRLGAVLITPGEMSWRINGEQDFFDNVEEMPNNSNKSATIMLYGWQWETRFADGGDITGIVEWIALVGGMERGLFLPSISSLVGLRTSKGAEFALGPNVSLSGVGMVFGAGYNFKSGKLNLPVNIAFVPGRIANGERRISDSYWDENGNEIEAVYENLTYETGSRISITIGFNMSK